MKNKVFLHLILILLAMAPVVAPLAATPVSVRKIVLSWQKTRVVSLKGSPLETALSFRGSALSDDFGLLPVLVKSFTLDRTGDPPDAVTLTDALYQPIDPALLVHVKGLEKIGPEPALSSRYVSGRNQSRITITLLPLRRNSQTGQVEQLVAGELVMNFSAAKSATALKSAPAYVPHSVLASGAWYKFATATDGVYRLTFDDLKKAGIAAEQINPRNIRIYGNGGGMLPEANAAARIDDLMENAVFVSGEDDGAFNQGDYILFYGQGPDRWKYNSGDKLFHARKNVYADRTYYFLNFDIGPGKRITSEPSTTKAPTFYASRFEDFAAYEKDDKNLIKSGREWWDEQIFDLTTDRTYSFSFPNIDGTQPLSVTTYVAARSTSGSTSFVVAAQGSPLMTLNIDRVVEGFENVYANTKAGTASMLTSNPLVDVKLAYNKSSSSSVGWLNYIEVNATRMLAMYGGQMGFRSAAGTMANGVTEFSLNGNGQNPEIWDVTSGGSVRRVETVKSGNNYVFRLETDTLREFRAFDGSAFAVAEFAGRIDNQDLHGTDAPDYLMVVYPAFMAEAERLAAFHRENTGLTVFITTPDKIYNEFSSGAQDITAIRDYVRMMYNKTGQGGRPRYLLLFGDASYDYKNRIQGNTNFIPTYESTESLSPVSSFVSDDYFGLLDPDEGQGAKGDLDIGIGRLPVSTIEQAASAVDKVLHYCSQSDLVKNDWRNVVTFVGDDQNEGGNLFIEYSEDLAKIIEKTYKKYNVDKIYSDAYTMISTPGGVRYPDVNQAITKRVEKGSLIMNYIGHGGEVGWAHERILEVADIQGWQNYNNLPVFVTATCEFSRFDDPGRVSAGEWVFLNNHGGGIALFTTARLTFAGTNQSLLVNFYDNVFRKTNGKYMRMGDLLVAAKSDMGSSPNIHAFVLLGDPAMQMAYPDFNVVTTTVNAQVPASVPDTLKALSEVTITGEVRNLAGEKAVDFSGTIFPTVFDKASENWTRANSGEYPPVQFFLQKNPVYKGQVEVVNGTFTFSFIVPKDIAYKYGVGKISYYARSGGTDANGYDDNIQVGGFNNEAPLDDQGPQLALYINNRQFRSGGITSQNPVLLADVSDTSGVNTVGNGIGHDITAVLDNKSTSPMILNDYYVSDLNTYKSGEISYPLNGLSDGPHQISVKVWDVHNNSTDATIDFIVVSSAEFAFEHLFNFPNPMRDHTTFSWESNQVNEPVEVEIQIVSLNGRPVKKLNQVIYAQGFRTATIQWDGTQDDGSKVSSGLYVYSVQLTLPNGAVSQQTSKLVVIR